MWSGVLLEQHTLDGFPDIGFYLTFYVIKYHVRRDDALPGVFLCDIPLYFMIRVPNILESFPVLPIVQPIKRISMALKHI